MFSISEEDPRLKMKDEDLEIMEIWPWQPWKPGSYLYRGEMEIEGIQGFWGLDTHLGTKSVKMRRP